MLSLYVVYIYVVLKVLYFILSDDDFEIKSKIYSFSLRLVLKHILHSQDDFFRDLLFTLLFSIVGLSWFFTTFRHQTWQFYEF